MSFSYDIIGSIAILKFSRETGNKKKKKIALRLLKERKNIKTVLEKIERVKGRLRTYKTRFLVGIKTKETVHKESGCRFKLDVEKTYFSPRLSNERIEVARKIKKGSKVLVLFSGVAPYSIIIAKLAKPKKVISVEINRKACEYARENIKMNKLQDKIELIQGDVKKLKLKEKFDYVVMPRPQLKESFLKEAFKFSKKGTEIFYYDFGSDVDKILERIYFESKKAGKKILILRVKKAGEIAPYKYRWRIDLRVLN